MRQLHTLHIDALFADTDLRRCDERFVAQHKYLALPNPLHNKGLSTTCADVFTPRDFAYDADARTWVCPAGKSLYRKGRANRTKDYIGEHVRGAKRDCGPCTLFACCRRAASFTSRANRSALSPSARSPLMTLITTSRPSASSRATNTRDMPSSRDQRTGVV